MAFKLKDQHEFSDFVEEALMKAIKGKINEIIDKEAEAAAGRVEQEVKKPADQVALNIFEWYSVEDMRHEIIIRVQKNPNVIKTEK